MTEYGNFEKYAFYDGFLLFIKGYEKNGIKIGYVVADYN